MRQWLAGYYDALILYLNVAHPLLDAAIPGEDAACADGAALGELPARHRVLRHEHDEGADRGQRAQRPRGVTVVVMAVAAVVAAALARLLAEL